MTLLTDNLPGPALAGLVILVLTLLLSLPVPAVGEPGETVRSLQSLSAERQMLASEVEQYEKTLGILQTSDTPAEQSANPAIKKLAQEVVRLKKRLIAVTEKEVALLQQHIAANRKIREQAASDAATDDTAENPTQRVHNLDYTLAQEADYVARLYKLLASYYAELQESSLTQPTDEEMAQRELAQKDAQTLALIPFSADKVRLNGSEGSTALSQITQRLMDPGIPESRRDIAPICAIKTRLFGSLVSSENRSLKPVGKNHYIARIRLQPGDTTLRIMDHRWEIRLPQDISANDYLITLYRPPGGAPELHVFAIDDLLAQDQPHIPAWLPDDLKINTRTG